MLSEKNLERMLRSRDPVRRLVAADVLEESGRADPTLRENALRALEIAKALKRANVGKRIRAEFPVGGGLSLSLGGGEQIMTACLVETAPGKKRVSFFVHLRRDLLAKDSYVNRRASELSESLVKKPFVFRKDAP